MVDKSPNSEVKNALVLETLQRHLSLGERFVEPPQVVLKLATQSLGEQAVGVRDIAITTAIQCYAPGVAQVKERVSEKERNIGLSTLEAGHHTTRQHAHFTWHIINASRDVIRENFHENPFYNSEQQSQRYVEAKSGNYLRLTDLTPEQSAFYTSAADFANQAYFSLLELLGPEVSRRIHDMYPAAGWNYEKTAKRLEAKEIKIAQEVARYVLPIAQRSTFYHTLSELQLLRLFRESEQSYVTDEARYLIAQMITTAMQYDHTLLDELEPPLPNYFQENYDLGEIRSAKDYFDSLIGDRNSLLINLTTDSGSIIARSAANVMGRPYSPLVHDTILDSVVNPTQNRFLSDVYETGMFDPITRSLRNVTATFATKMSHTGDSQRQRHRRTPGDSPTITASYDGSPDYLTPMIINGNPEIKAKYDELMSVMYENVRHAITIGIPMRDALRLLPNAHAVRTYEQGDLFDWLHRWKQRLCLLAQEEIFFVSAEQVSQVVERFPESENMLVAPCGLAHQAKTGRCPEGDRWCGKPIWNLKAKQYAQQRLV